MAEGESRENVPTGSQSQSYRRHDVLKLPHELLEENFFIAQIRIG